MIPSHANQTLFPMSRRRWLAEVGQGFGSLALAGLLQRETIADHARSVESIPSAVRSGHFASRAKRVIFLFMDGGPSQIDLFDPKPRLNRDHGQPLPFEKPKLA